MASAQTLQPANDFTIEFCPNFSFRIPDHTPASSSGLPKDLSGADFEFINPALLRFESTTPIRRSNIWVSKKSVPNGGVIAEKIFDNRGLEQQFEKNRGAKKRRSWREILGILKPPFLRRSNSASKAEKLVSLARNPCLQRSESDPKCMADPKSISGCSRKDPPKPCKYRKLAYSHTIRRFGEDVAGGMSPATMGSPARMDSPKYFSPSCEDTIAMGGVFGADFGPSKLQKSMQQAGRREDLQRYLKRPSSHQLVLPLVF